MTQHVDNASSHDDDWNYETWVTTRVPEHVAGILEILQNLPEVEAWRSERHRRFSVNPETGHLGDRQLCWVCFAERAHAGRFTPRFRACFFCVKTDRAIASGIGLKMLLPLMNWPSQPVLAGRTFPRDPLLVHELGKLWSSVSLLDRWRIEGVQAAYAGLTLAPGERMTIEPWQRRVGVGVHRSREQVLAYLEEHFPVVAAAVSGGGSR